MTNSNSESGNNTVAESSSVNDLFSSDFNGLELPEISNFWDDGTGTNTTFAGVNANTQGEMPNELTQLSANAEWPWDPNAPIDFDSLFPDGQTKIE
jgi:hypothetical protein